MSTITREQLITQAQENVAQWRDAMQHNVNTEYAAIRLRLAEIALASLEAEAVAYMYKDNLHTDARFSLYKRFGNWSQEDINEYEITEIPLYAAPPAPVSVPDELTREEYKRRFMEDDDFDDTFRGGWKAHRAAMLQGADGNSPVILDGWVACSERMPKKGQEVLCTDQFENYETALYDTGYIPGPPFFATTAGEFHPTHWMPLPAAPQQGVTQALAKGMERYGSAMQELAKREVKS